MNKNTILKGENNVAEQEIFFIEPYHGMHFFNDDDDRI